MKSFQQFSHYYFVWGCVLRGSVLSDSLRPHGLQPDRLLCPWDFPGKNTEVGCLFLLPGIFPTQGSSQPRDLTHVPLCLLCCRWVPYRSCHLGSPQLLILTEYLCVSDSAGAGRHNRNTEQIKTPAITEFLFQCILIHVYDL